MARRHPRMVPLFPLWSTVPLKLFDPDCTGLDNGQLSAVGLEGPEDPLSAKTRELQDSELFNQETVAQDGTMVAPELSLSGKIIQRANRVGDKQQVDYYFQLTATNIETGLAYWEFEEVIAKIGGNQEFSWE